jgi:multidrug efflux system membrane fusion protein
VPYAILASGIVTPSQTAVVSPQVDGIITSVEFHEGQDVTAGQPLFRIEQQQYQSALQAAQAVLARDVATAANARLEAARYAMLAANGNATAEQADQQKATADASIATVLADTAAVATARFNLGKTVIRAPIGGRTGSLLVHEGNLVHAAGSTALVTISQLHPILVRFAVPASELRLIQQYSAHGELHVGATHGPAQAVPDSSSVSPSSAPAAADPSDPPDPAEPGTLSFIDNAVDTTTGTVMLKATFSNPTRSLWPGQFVSVTLRLFTEDSALVLPTQAVLTGQQGAYVYIVDSTGAAQQRNVVVERAAGTLVVIKSGLRGGEKVVAEGQSRLTPGATVSLPTADSAHAGGAAGGRRGAGGGSARRAP